MSCQLLYVLVTNMKAYATLMTEHILFSVTLLML